MARGEAIIESVPGTYVYAVSLLVSNANREIYTVVYTETPASKMFNSSKRSRVESHLEESDEAPRKTRVVRDEVVSFDDGNIDITAGVTSFRVHRGVLSVHSEVFSDMLSMPQPEGSVTSDGCPCVEVTDSADDLRELLLVLYHRHPCVALPCIMCGQAHHSHTGISGRAGPSASR